ncbi:MAG: serine/threonine-protein phosphatase [Cyanothece sp. SIO1E1]|nr:serine/threonine-protein phosphatase [Cyanothece sp. SIO1E1]
MKCLFAGLTDPGLLRPANQDAYYIDPEGRFFIVADGMGGHAGGQEASQIATQAIQSYLDEYWHTAEASDALLEKAFLKANHEILQDQKRHPERSDMGTTAVVVISRGAPAYWCAHTGDSRLYRLRETQMVRMTEDHTWVTRALKEGELNPEQVRNHPWRHVLSQCLGREDLRKIEIQPLDIQPGDRLLLCSDGLTEELSDAAIESYWQSVSTCEQVVEILVQAAKDRGGRDNITVIVVSIPPQSQPQDSAEFETQSE